MFFCDADAYAYIGEHEVETTSCYSAQKSRNLGVHDVKNLEGHRIWWEDPNNKTGSGPHIPPDNVPYIVLGHEVRECHQGPNRRHTDTETQNGKRLIQNTKKQNCLATVRLRKILKFPEYEIQGTASQWKKKKMAKQLKDSFTNQTLKEYRVYVSLPKEEDHACHLIGEMAAYCLPVDRRINRKIVELVDDGIRRVPEVKKLLELFVRDLEVTTTNSNRRFFPTDVDIRNHIYQAIVASRFCKNDQQNLQILVNKWKEDSPKDKFFYQPVQEIADNTNTDYHGFLFVHQTEFQSRLLIKYGQEIVLMDSTHNTMQYQMPLYLICVLTNVGYKVVGAFVIGKESRHNIKEGLAVLKTWNPGWNPPYFMCDNDVREIGAIESLFEDCTVALCDFHREQAWERYVKEKKHNLSDQKEEVLSMLRKIARSKTEAAYKINVTILRQSKIYTDNEEFQQYIEKRYLLEKERWVNCFRNSILNIRVSTTNGLERQNWDFKHKYLKEFGQGKTLCSMISTLVEKFVPENEKKYKRMNVTCLTENRRYHHSVPLFLHNKPRHFVVHCLDRLPPKVSKISSSQITSTTEGFLVRSTDSGTDYTISIGNDKPSCSCPDWAKFFWPCKHLLAVFSIYPAYGWEFMPNGYTSQPVFNLDTDFQKPYIMFNDGNDRMDISPDTTVTEKSVRNNCFDILKQITSGLYIISSTDTLLKIEGILQTVDTLLDDSTPKLSGLPVKHKRKTIITKKQKSTISQPGQDKTRKGIVDEPSKEQLGGGGGNLVCGQQQQMFPGIDLTPYENEVDNIWSRNMTTDTIRGKCGPFIISDTSIHQLKTFLSDEVLDSYLYVLSQVFTGVYHIDAVVFTAIVNNAETLHGLMRGVKIYDYEYIVAALHEGGNHWTLVIIQPKKKVLVYLNPLGETCLSERRLQRGWQCFLQKRYQQHIDANPPDTWQVETRPHAKQTDGISCGIYILKFAENFLSGLSLKFHLTAEDKIIYRRRLGAFLLLQIDSTGQEVKENTAQEAKESTAQEAKESTAQEAKESIVQEAKESTAQEVKESSPQEAKESTAQEVKESAAQEVKESTAQELKESTGQKVKESTAQEMKESTAQEVKESTAQELKESSPQEVKESAAQELKENENDLGHQEDQSGAPAESCTRWYNTRTNPKKKRQKSFIFPSYKIGGKYECICNNKTVEGSYWSCATCERNFHPHCLRYAEHSIKPFDFHCPECELSPAKAVKRKRYSVEMDKESEVTEEIPDFPCKQMDDGDEIGDNLDTSDKEGFTDDEDKNNYTITDDESEVEFEDDFNLEFADFERLRIQKHMYEIMSCEDSKCEEVEHVRHHEFVSAPQTVYNRERRTFAFGSEVLNRKLVDALHKYLIQNLVYNHKEPFRFGGRRIINLRNSKLEHIFIQYKMMADQYVTYVLHKEAIIYLHQRQTGCAYEFANEKCLSSEVDLNKEIKRIRSK